MRKNVPTLFIILLIITSEFVSGKGNKTKTLKNNHKTHFSKEKYENERVKRSLIANDDDDGGPFWPNRGKKQSDEEVVDTKTDNSLIYSQKFVKSNDKVIKDEPFWANRGRRDSTENIYDYDNADFMPKYCDGCSGNKGLYKDRRENFMSPFWGSRGRRNSLEDVSEPFWGNRGRREENEPFWGNRGRRTDDEPFWGNRGRRDDEPFWGNRGRREDSEPFWGNRGRRDDSEPFWGNRGRRHENEPFWGNRGRRENAPFWSNRGRRKQDLKDSIMSAISDVENDIDDLSRLKRPSLNFWGNRGRDSRMSHMFNEPSRSRVTPTKPKPRQAEEPGSVLDNRMFVEEPNYIIVERMGRSSGESDDPYYISRGKKYFLSHSLEKAARDRRGAIEEIVKTVQNDPYYIARGKKDTEVKNNTTPVLEEYTKAKELVCAAVDLILAKQNGKVKRHIDSDNERNRRTTLKKLAAQLQADPYFVSRGKKSDINGEKDNLDKFISDIAEKCN